LTLKIRCFYYLKIQQNSLPNTDFILEFLMDLSIFGLIRNAGIVVQAIIALLCIMSIYSWTVIFTKYFTLNAAHKKGIEGLREFEKAKSLRDAVQNLGHDTTSPLYAVAQYGVTEFNLAKEALVGTDVVVNNVRRSLHQGVNNETNKLNGAIAILATCSSSAPFIGLFGTVWGIMSSFQAIGLMKSAALATVAPGISEALIATALGLAVAIPAAISYNLFLSKIITLENLLVDFAGTFLNRVQRELHSQKGTPSSTTLKPQSNK